jgi:hypothetical protein
MKIEKKNQNKGKNTGRNSMRSRRSTCTSQISIFPKREMGDTPVKSGHPIAIQKCEYNLIILIYGSPSRRTSLCL